MRGGCRNGVRGGGGGGGVIDEGERARANFLRHTSKRGHGCNHLHSVKFLFPGYLNVAWAIVPRRIRYAIETRAT